MKVFKRTEKPHILENIEQSLLHARFATSEGTGSSQLECHELRISRRFKLNFSDCYFLKKPRIVPYLENYEKISTH